MTNKDDDHGNKQVQMFLQREFRWRLIFYITEFVASTTFLVNLLTSSTEIDLIQSQDQI